RAGTRKRQRAARGRPHPEWLPPCGQHVTGSGGRDTSDATRDVRAPSKPPTPRTVRAVGTPVFVSGSVGSAVLLPGSVPLEESIDGRSVRSICHPRGCPG